MPFSESSPPLFSGAEMAAKRENKRFRFSFFHFLKLNGEEYAIMGGITLLLAYMFYYKLGGYALLDNNEGLYAQIPLEMLKSGDLVIPTLNSNPYIEKPPLLYWLIMLVYKYLGVSEWTSRLVPATSGFLLCLSLHYFSRLTPYEKAKWLGPLMLGTSLGFIVFSRMIFFDVLLTLWFSLCLFSFYAWYEKERKIWLYSAYIFLALAVLTKGFLALILAGGIVFTFFLFDRTRFRKILAFLNLGPLLALILLLAPWHVFASVREEGFAWFYFMNEHILRFLDLREPRDYYHGPIYYYIPRLLAYIFPWTLFSLFLFKKSSVRGLSKLNKFLWIWFLAGLAFFSLSQAKANYYAVLVIPPFIMLMAMKIEDAMDYRQGLLIRGLVTFMTLLLTAALAVGVYYKGDLRLAVYQSLIPEGIAWGWGGYCALGLLIMWIFPKKTYTPPLFLASLAAPLLFIALKGASSVEDMYSMKNIMRDIPASPSKESIVYLYRDYEKISTALYYGSSPLPIIESHSSDLLYGMKNPYNSKLFISMPAFEKALSQQVVYVVARDKYRQELKEKGLCLLSRRGEKILMSNQCEG